MAENIHPVFNRMVSLEDRCQLLGQRPICLWLCGLSGSGKSTIALHLEKKLYEMGYMAQVLDGDNIRSGINANLGFSQEDRLENNRRIAEITKLYNQSALITINSFISPTHSIREMSRNIIGEPFYREIYVKASLETCEKRDVKGLYAKARAGQIKGFTGIDSLFEEPNAPYLVLNTETNSIDRCVDILLESILKDISLDKK